MIEQAKGILMARHAIDADRAFEMLREHSQHNGRKLVDVAQAVVDSHLSCSRRCRRRTHAPSPRCRTAGRCSWFKGVARDPR